MDQEITTPSVSISIPENAHTSLYKELDNEITVKADRRGGGYEQPPGGWNGQPPGGGYEQPPGGSHQQLEGGRNVRPPSNMYPCKSDVYTLDRSSGRDTRTPGDFYDGSPSGPGGSYVTPPNSRNIGTRGGASA